MNLADLMDEVASVLDEITGLRVTAFPPATLSPPAGYVTYPEEVSFDETYGRGTDRISGLKFALLSGKVTDRSARDVVCAWAAGTGEKSVKQLMEAHRWASCDDLTVESCSFDVETIAGVDYLAVVFSANAYGSGTS